MLPILLLLFVQGLSAAQFPNLSPNIHLNWNGTNISIDTSKTASNFKGEVPNFILCGRFNSEQQNRDCQVQYSTRKQTPYSSSSSSGSYRITAYYYSQTNLSNTCMTFQNPISDFMTYYNGTASGQTSWDVTYTCDNGTFFSLSPSIKVGLLLVFLGLFIGCFIKRVYQNKKGKDLTKPDVSGAYNHPDPTAFYSPNGMNSNPYTVQTGRYNGNPSPYNPPYGAPPAQYNGGYPGYNGGNPGSNGGNQGYNGGNAGYNPGYNGGNQGYNPTPTPYGTNPGYGGNLDYAKGPSYGGNGGFGGNEQYGRPL